MTYTPSYYTYLVDSWRSVTVPVQRLATSEVVDREVLAEHPQVAEVVMERLREGIRRGLAERGWQGVGDMEVSVEEDVMRNQLIYRAVVDAADVWEDGTWTSVRAAVAEDQAILDQHLRGRPDL